MLSHTSYIYPTQAPWSHEGGIDVERRMKEYVLGAAQCLQMPIAAVMITYPDAVLGGMPVSTPPHSGATTTRTSGTRLIQGTMELMTK